MTGPARPPPGLARGWTIACIGLGAILVSYGLVLDPDGLRRAIFRTSWFYTRPLIADLRMALILTGGCVAALPWLWAAAKPSQGHWQSGARLSRPIDSVFVAILCALAAAHIVRRDPVTTDTKYYLGAALQVADRGGPLGLIEGCFDATWIEDNRHPLYLAALSPFAQESNRFLDSARLVSLAGAIVTLLQCLRACRRRGGEVAATFGGLWLVCTGSFVELATTVGCESWWTAFAVGAIDLATREEAVSERRRWFAVGTLLGLAFLTKGTGTLLTLSVLLWIALRERRAAWRPILLSLAALVLVASPLLVRNVRLHGDPFWNINSSRIFWLEHWSQFFDPQLLEHASAWNVLQSHSTLEIVTRMAEGSVKQCVHLLEAFAPFVPSPAFGPPLLMVCVIALIRLASPRERGLLLTLAALWLGAFAWYAAVASDRRFLAVLVPIAIPVAARWATCVGRPARTRAVLLLALPVLGIASILRGALEFRPAGFEPAPWNAELRGFLRERTATDPDAIYLLGPSRTLGFDWDAGLSATRLPRPETESQLTRMLADSRGGQVRFLVVETPAARARVGDGWIQVEPNGTLAPGPASQGWRPVAGFPAGVPHALVFERVR